MGSIYVNKICVGHCENGIIYSGSENRNPIGRYERGGIYNQFREQVGSYSDGSIYNKFNEHIASYDSGLVYNKYLNSIVGKESIGAYEGDPAGAAALVLLFLGETATNSVNTTIESNTNESYANESFVNTTYYSSSDESGGFLDVVLALIGSIIHFIFVKVIPCYFIYFWLPSTFMITWFGIICLIICMIFAYVGLVPLIILFGIPLMIIQYLFIPYYIFVVVVKIKTKCSTKEIFKLFWGWFLKGPFAYPEVVNIMTENNIMPKVTKIANKIIVFFKKKFSKKENK